MCVDGVVNEAGGARVGPIDLRQDAVDERIDVVGGKVRNADAARDVVGHTRQRETNAPDAIGIYHVGIFDESISLIVVGHARGHTQFNIDGLPGETVALREVFGLENCRIRRVPYTTTQSYMIYEPDSK